MTIVLLTPHECPNTTLADVLPTVLEHLLKSNYCLRRMAADARAPEESLAFTGLTGKQLRSHFWYNTLEISTCFIYSLRRKLTQ